MAVGEAIVFVGLLAFGAYALRLMYQAVTR